MASWCNQRHTVVSLMRATMPHCCASRTMSAQLKRDSGSPRVAGSSQARALICTTSSGGKSPGAAWARVFVKSWYAFMEEPFAPQAHHIATDRKRGGDLVVGATLGGEQNYPGSQYLEIWQRIFARSTLQDLAFLAREPNRKRAVSRHFGGLPWEDNSRLANTWQQ
jgi:hypothetical protein